MALHIADARYYRVVRASASRDTSFVPVSHDRGPFLGRQLEGMDGRGANARRRRVSGEWRDGEFTVSNTLVAAL